MSLPALRAVRSRFPDAHVTVLALPWVSDLYERERWVDRVIPYSAPRGAHGWTAKWTAARRLRVDSYDTALILPNSFDSALTPWLAGIPRRIGFARDARKWLLTDPVPPVVRGSIPLHESYYYLELLHRIGWIDHLPDEVVIRLEGAAEARAEGLAQFARRQLAAPLVGISPGAAYGTAKRWLPERFAEAAIRLSSPRAGSVALFGTASEKALCEQVRTAILHAGIPAVNLAGATSLREFIQLAAACHVFLTNDSGSMHIASALNVPTVAIFGATDHVGTGPTGDRARVVRQHVDCSPCLLRDCPIDHRCMTAVTSERVALTALELLK